MLLYHSRIVEMLELTNVERCDALHMQWEWVTSSRIVVWPKHGTLDMFISIAKKANCIPVYGYNSLNNTYETMYKK